MVSYLSTFPGLILPHIRTSGLQLRVIPETLYQFAKDELGLIVSLHTATLALQLHSTALPILTLHLTTRQINENLLTNSFVHGYICSRKKAIKY